MEQPPITLLNHANVFCREGLDIGTRAFLPHLPEGLGERRVADLGCGNGVLGIACALANPQAQLTLVDESYMAVQSARENWQAALGDRPGDPARRRWVGWPGTGFAGAGAVQPALPPATGGGRLARLAHVPTGPRSAGARWRAVDRGNRHLGYHAKLSRLFRSVQQVAATPKFVVLKATK
jgi:23S rRNA (guanine1835-N2)-methyltransferase